MAVMAKTLAEGRITTRQQRKKLAPGEHWRSIDPDVHLGYRKGKRGGKWVVRWYLGDQEYQQKTFATADDELREGTLDFNAAVRTARALVEAARRDARAVAEGPLLTVRHAIELYTAARDARESGRKGREIRSDSFYRLRRHVVGAPQQGKRKKMPAAPLADVPLHELSEANLLDWRAALPDHLKASTKRRLATDLKAALNGTYAANRNRLPSTLPETIKHGLRAIEEADEGVSVARENQILTDLQVARLIRAARETDAEQGWNGDLLRLVWVLAATGARYSQVTRMRVGDVQEKAGHLVIPVSRKGRGVKNGSIPFPVDADLLVALMPALTGRPKDAILLERWQSKRVAGSIRWERADRGPWQTPSQLSRPWAAIRQRAGMPNVIPYALRHSSIVRYLRDNQPTQLVAKLHDTSLAMIERHYARYIADGLHELAARSVFRLGRRGDENKIVPLVRA